jgi:acetyl esterase
MKMADVTEFRMVPDASVEALFAARRGKPLPDYRTLTIAAARASFASAQAATVIEKPVLDAIDDIRAEWKGVVVRLRLYRPTHSDQAQPALVYFHGGGWVMGGLDSHDHICRSLAREAGVVVIAVGYPLAPETRYPGQVRYGLSAMHWIFANAAALNLDGERIAVAGDSAGGNIAAVLALHSRNGELPALKAQILIYPVLDLTMSGASYAHPHPDLSITGEAMDWYIGHYLPDRRLASNWQASTFLVESVAGLCPSFVMTAGCDVVASEGRAYADRLRSAGVSLVEKSYPGQIHAFLGLPHLLPEARRAFFDIANYLRAHVSAPMGDDVDSLTP